MSWKQLFSPHLLLRGQQQFPHLKIKAYLTSFIISILLPIKLAWWEVGSILFLCFVTITVQWVLFQSQDKKNAHFALEWECLERKVRVIQQLVSLVMFVCPPAPWPVTGEHGEQNTGEISFLKKEREKKSVTFLQLRWEISSQILRCPRIRQPRCPRLNKQSGRRWQLCVRGSHTRVLVTATEILLGSHLLRMARCHVGSTNVSPRTVAVWFLIPTISVSYTHLRAHET